MGILIIQTKGSFGTTYKEFSAMEHGHAHAVTTAMEHLTHLMQDATNNDHKCRDESINPSKGFQKSSPRNGQK